MDQAFRTLASEVRWETEKIKGSRFFGTALPIANEAELTARIAGLRTLHPEAGHHAWAWRFGERFRYSDDGEPSGTAGRPILQQMDGKQLDRCGVVVTRIFGGTKLGAGGLIRAYGRAAAETLQAGRIVDVIPTSRVTVELPYALVGSLDSVSAARGMTPESEQYGESVRKQFDVPIADVEGFVAEIRERTAGRATVNVAGPAGRAV